jgi:very-short-patch-repair endonuclease
MPSRRTQISRQMRQSLNHTEVRMWACLRGRQLDGWKFRRQHPIGPYFVDFCCPAAGLVVEVVGPAHDDDVQWAYDQRRYTWLEARGYRVVRVRAQDIDLDMEGVMGRIFAELLEREQLGVRRVRTDAEPGPSAA